MNESEKKELPRFIKFLFGLSPEKDRGVLADLRRGFSKASETRAWPHLGRFCNLDGRDRVVYQTIAAGYATHPENDASGFANFGTAMRGLAGFGEEASGTFDVYFRRILACDCVDDVCERLKAPILAAKSKGVKIPWVALYWDLIKWEEDSEKIKTKWAAQYWRVPADCAPVEIEGAPIFEEND